MAFRAAFRSSSEIVFLQSPSFSFTLLIRSGSGFSSGMIAFLVIPGCCAIFALESLHLKRRPLARDEGTYSAGLYTLRQPAFCRCLRHVPLSNALLLLYSGRLLVASGSVLAILICRAGGGGGSGDADGSGSSGGSSSGAWGWQSNYPRMAPIRRLRTSPPPASPLSSDTGMSSQLQQLCSPCAKFLAWRLILLTSISTTRSDRLHVGGLVKIFEHGPRAGEAEA